MAFTDFYITSSGNDLNAGSTSGAATYTSSAGNWDGTSVFTPTDGSTPSSSVSAGMWAAVYVGSAPSAAKYVGQITAVGAGTNGTITVPAANSFGTVPSSGSGNAVIRVGGAWADFGITASGAALGSGTVTQSTRVNVQAGTYSPSATIGFSLAGTATKPLWWRGYQTTPGDQDGNALAAAGTAIPSVTMGTNQFQINGAHQIFSSLDISGSSTTASSGQVTVASGATNVLFYHFRATNTASSSNGLAFYTDSTSGTYLACYFKATTTAAETVYAIGTGFHYFLGCYVTGGAIGLRTTEATFLQRCVFDSCGGDAVSASGELAAVNCSFYAPTGNGIEITSVNSGGVLVANCYFDSVSGAGKYAINNTSGTNTDLIRCIGNAYYNCTGNVNGLGDFPLVFDNGTLAGSAFVGVGSGNFTLNSLGYNLGYPGTLEKLASSVGYLDVGALQHQGGGMGQIMRVVGQHFPVW